MKTIHHKVEHAQINVYYYKIFHIPKEIIV